MPPRQPDDLAQELLVDLSEDVRGKNGEFVGAFGIVKPLDDLFEHPVVNGEARRQLIRWRGPPFLLVEVKKPGVVSLVGSIEKLAEPRVDIGAVLKGPELAVMLDAPVLADAEEDHAVNRTLDGEVQLSLS